MKFLFLLAVLAIAPSTYAQEGEDIVTEENCDQMVFYRPGGSSLAEARYSFQTEMDQFVTSYRVQELVKAKEGNFYVKGFTQTSDEDSATKTLVYELIEFEDPRNPTERTCTITERQARRFTIPMSDGPIALNVRGTPEFPTELKETCTDKQPSL